MQATDYILPKLFQGWTIMRVPFFQRSYVWNEEQWTRFLEDMKEISEGSGYGFMGAIILKAIDSNPGEGEIFHVIDGQQRLTTINIFLHTLCLLKGSEDFSRSGFILQSGEGLCLQHSHQDRESFQKVMSMNSPTSVKNPSSRIEKAYNFFLKNIDPDNYDFRKIMQLVKIVVISLDKDEDEQKIFDTINSLGTRLTAAEILKNFLFSSEDTEEFHKKWVEIFEKDRETIEFWDSSPKAAKQVSTEIELLLHSSLVQMVYAGKGLIETIPKMHKERLRKKDRVTKSFKALVNQYGFSRKEIIDNIANDAKVWRENFNHSIEKESIDQFDQIQRAILAISIGEAAPLKPYLIYLLSRGSKEDILAIGEMIETIVMRRMIASEPKNTWNFDHVLDILLSKRILSKEEFREVVLSVSSSVDSSKSFIPSDEDIRRVVKDASFARKSPRATAILYLLESRLRKTSGRHSTMLLGLENYSLEHLMPRKWEEHWKHGLMTEEMIEERNRKIHSIGNLAIIPSKLNASISNRDWNTKRFGNDRSHGLIHYGSGLETLAPFLTKETWDEKAIDERTSWITEKIIRLYPDIKTEGW